MNRLELLNQRLKDIDRLIGKEEAEDELVTLGAERDEVIKEIAKEELKIENAKQAEKDKAEAEKKEFAEGQKKASVVEPVISVKDTDNYRGVNLKMAVGLAKSKVPLGVKDMMDRNYDAAERVARWFTDMYKDAVAVPGRKVGKAMTEGTDSAGGYVTPTVESMEILGYIRETSIALQDATTISMTSDKMTYPREDATVTVANRSEGSSVTASSATYAQVELSTVNFDAYTPASKELVADSPVLIANLMSQFNEAVAKKVDSAVFAGTGSPMSSIFSAAAGYSEVFDSGSTAFSELLESNIRNIIAQIPPERLDNARFYVHNDPLWKYIRGLKDSNGQYLMNQTPMGQGAPDKIWGYPIRSSSQMPSTSGADTGFISFGDLKRSVYIGERLTNMTLMYDPYTDAANGNDRFFLFTRWAFAFALSNYIGRIVTAAS